MPELSVVTPKSHADIVNLVKRVTTREHDTLREKAQELTGVGCVQSRVKGIPTPERRRGRRSPTRVRVAPEMQRGRRRGTQTGSEGLRIRELNFRRAWLHNS